MKIYIGADHRGFELKNKLVDWLKNEDQEVRDCGNTKYDPEDDYPDFAKAVAEKLKWDVGNEKLDNEVGIENKKIPPRTSKIQPLTSHFSPQQNLGILICGSGVGVCVVANRTPGIICALGFDEDQIKHARENDHINCLSLPSNHINFEKAKKIVTAFIYSKPKMEEKYLRRLRKIDNGQ